VSKPTGADYREAAVHLAVMLIIAVALGVLGWICGTHGYVLTYWWS